MRWIMAGLAALVLTMGIMGAVTIAQMVERLKEVEDRADAVEELNLGILKRQVQQIDLDLASLNLPPDLSRDIAQLERDINGLERQDTDTLELIRDVVSVSGGTFGGGGVQKPGYCLYGDVVTWGFGDDLDCRF